jgi:hypothetical protein
MKWRAGGFNWNYLGFNHLLLEISQLLPNSQNLKMLEIGSYMGESTAMFASTGIFNEIHCIDPHDGYEEANDIFDKEWVDVKAEFDINTRHFNNIIMHQDYSYNIVDEFEDNYFDLIYIDAAHTYESVKKDIELYLPKCKRLMAGHDYSIQWPGVMLAVNELLGNPHFNCADSSWIKKIK